MEDTLAAGLMPGMRKAADIVVAKLLQHLTASKGPGRLDGQTTPEACKSSTCRQDDAGIPLDGCGLMPEQQQSKVGTCPSCSLLDPLCKGCNHLCTGMKRSSDAAVMVEAC